MKDLLLIDEATDEIVNRSSQRFEIHTGKLRSDKCAGLEGHLDQ